MLVGDMKQIMCSDWLPERARWARFDLWQTVWNRLSYVRKVTKRGRRQSKQRKHERLSLVFVLQAQCRGSRHHQCNLESFYFVLNPPLTKLVRSRWLNTSLFPFLRFYNLDFVSVHQNAKQGNSAKNHRDLTIVTSGLINNAYNLRLSGMKIKLLIKRKRIEILKFLLECVLTSNQTITSLTLISSFFC